MEPRYNVVPLAEKGFVSIGPFNPVRWYIEDTTTGRLLAVSYSTAAEADAKAAEYNVPLCGGHICYGVRTMQCGKPAGHSGACGS